MKALGPAPIGMKWNGKVWAKKPAFKTHCRRGHELSPENLCCGVKRRCKICNRLSEKRYRDKPSTKERMREYGRAWARTRYHSDEDFRKMRRLRRRMWELNNPSYYKAAIENLKTQYIRKVLKQQGQIISNESIISKRKEIQLWRASQILKPMAQLAQFKEAAANIQR